MKDAQTELECFERENTEVLLKYLELKNNLLIATKQYKKDLLEEYQYMIGKTCFLPNHSIGLINSIRLSNKSMAIICNVCDDRFETNEYPIKNLKYDQDKRVLR